MNHSIVPAFLLCACHESQLSIDMPLRKGPSVSAAQACVHKSQQYPDEALGHLPQN